MKLNILNILFLIFSLNISTGNAQESSFTAGYNNLYETRLQNVLKSGTFNSVLNGLYKNHISIVKVYHKNCKTRKEVAKKIFGDSYQKLCGICISQIDEVSESNYMEVGQSILFLTDILVHEDYKSQLKRMYFETKYESVKDEILIGLARLGDQSVKKDLFLRLVHGHELNTYIIHYPDQTDKAKTLAIWDSKRSYFIDALRYIDSKKLKFYVEKFKYDGGTDTVFSVASYLLDNKIVQNNINELIVPAITKCEGLGYFKLLLLMHSHQAYFRENNAIKEQLYDALKSNELDSQMPALQKLKLILNQDEFDKDVTPSIELKVRKKIMDQLDELLEWVVK